MRFLLIIGLCLPFLALANKPEYAVQNIPSQLLIGAKKVIRSSSYIITAKSSDRLRTKRKVAITLLEQGTDAEYLLLPYDLMRKVVELKASIYDAQGNLIRTIKEDEIKDYSAYDGFSLFSDNRIKQVSLNYDQYPYTIEYEYEMVNKSSYFIPDWWMQDFYSAVESAHCKVIVHPDLDFQFKVANSSIEVKRSKENDLDVYEWKVEQLGAILEEPFLANDMEVLPNIRMHLGRFKFGGQEGSMRTWEEYGQFYYELNKRHNNLSDATKAKLDQLLTGAKDTTEKINRLYRYLQENMRYVSVQLGIGGWKSFDAAYVERNKYGDCKALTYFMKSMLEHIGIESYPALITYDDKPLSLDSQFVDIVFNHVILYLPEEKIWLECTSNSLPPNSLPTALMNRSVLWITPKGGELAKTPSYREHAGREVKQAEVTLAANGSAEVRGWIEGNGPAHTRFRFYSTKPEQKELERALHKELAVMPNFSIQDMKLSVEENEPKANWGFNLKVEKYTTKNGKRLFVPINTLSAWTAIPPKDSNRIYPIRLHDDQLLIDEIRLIIPDGYDVEAISDPLTEIERPFGRYKLAIQQNGEQVIIKRLLSLEATELPPSTYADLRKFFKQMAKADRQKVVLKQQKT